MIRVLMVSDDNPFCEEIREFLDRQLDFEVLAVIQLDAGSMKEVCRLLPDVTILVVLDAHGLSFAEAFKIELPELPLFLVSRRGTLETEQAALYHHVDAVFLAENELTSLASNAREFRHPAS
jgi:DNA-binding NarL/FixJ family response regulator